MLFILNGAGVPSVARMVQITPNGGTTGTVTGIVTNTSAVPLEGATVTAGTATATTGVDGSYTLTNVTAGQTTITASLAGYSNASQSVTIAAGIDNNVQYLSTCSNKPWNRHRLGGPK